jgi:hypothetical protein
MNAQPSRQNEASAVPVRRVAVTVIDAARPGWDPDPALVEESAVSATCQSTLRAPRVPTLRAPRIPTQRAPRVPTLRAPRVPTQRSSRPHWHLRGTKHQTDRGRA